MSEEKKKTLRLIEQYAASAANREQGNKHLLLVAADWTEDGDIFKARSVLRKIDEAFFREELARQAVSEEPVKNALVVLIDAFGADLYLAIQPNRGSA